MLVLYQIFVIVRKCPFLLFNIPFPLTPPKAAGGEAERVGTAQAVDTKRHGAVEFAGHEEERLSPPRTSSTASTSGTSATPSAKLTPDSRFRRVVTPETRFARHSLTLGLARYESRAPPTRRIPSFSLSAHGSIASSLAISFASRGPATARS